MIGTFCLSHEFHITHDQGSRRPYITEDKSTDGKPYWDCNVSGELKYDVMIMDLNLLTVHWRNAE